MRDDEVRRNLVPSFCIYKFVGKAWHGGSMMALLFWFGLFSYKFLA